MEDENRKFIVRFYDRNMNAWINLSDEPTDREGAKELYDCHTYNGALYVKNDEDFYFQIKEV